MKRILLADDSQQALRLGEQILAGQGIQVVSVTDGSTALRRLPDVDPDVLIVDVFLPVKNGFELARFIKAQPEWRHIGIVFAAGMADEFDEQDAKNAGAEVVLRKPFEASALLGAVQPLLQRAEADRGKKTDKAPGVDRAMVRSAVTLALDSAMPALIEELTERIMIAVRQQFVSQTKGQGTDPAIASAPEQARTAVPNLN
jgi:two-component system cell cycle response regulator DivK